MKKILNKKGFILTETLMVTAFIVGIFTFLYMSVLPLVGTYNDKTTRESDIDIVYKLYNIRKLISRDINRDIMTSSDFKELTCDDFYNKDYCENLIEVMELSNYKLIYVNKISNSINNLQNDQEIYNYIKDYQDSNDKILILNDKAKHTVVHLKYAE